MYFYVTISQKFPNLTIFLKNFVKQNKNEVKVVEGKNIHSVFMSLLIISERFPEFVLKNIFFSKKIKFLANFLTKSSENYPKLPNGQKSPKFRWRFLAKSCRHLRPQSRPIGEKSPQLGTLFKGFSNVKTQNS